MTAINTNIKANRLITKTKGNLIIIFLLCFLVGVSVGAIGSYWLDNTILEEEYKEYVLRDLDSLTVNKVYFLCREEGVRFARVAAVQALIDSKDFTSSLFLKKKNIYKLKVPFERYSFASNKDDFGNYASFSSISLCIKDYKSRQVNETPYVFNEESYIDWLQAESDDPNYGKKIRKLLDDYDKEF